MKRILLASAVFLAATFGQPSKRPAQPQGDDGTFVITDAPLRKGWGRCVGAYFDPRYGPVLVFEDTAGTVRQVSAPIAGETRMLSTLTRGGN